MAMVRAHGLTRSAAVQLLMNPALPRPPSLAAVDPLPFQIRQHVTTMNRHRVKDCSSCRGNHCIPHCESRRKTHLSPERDATYPTIGRLATSDLLTPSSDHQWCLASKALFHVMVLQSNPTCWLQPNHLPVPSGVFPTTTPISVAFHSVTPRGRWMPPHWWHRQVRQIWLN